MLVRGGTPHHAEHVTGAVQANEPRPLTAGGERGLLSAATRWVQTPRRRCLDRHSSPGRRAADRGAQPRRDRRRVFGATAALCVLKNHGPLPGSCAACLQCRLRLVQFTGPDGLCTDFVLKLFPTGKL